MKVKGFLLAGAAGVAAAPGVVSAADLAVKAPPPPAPATWAGWYIGANAGAAWQTASQTYNYTGGSTQFQGDAAKISFIGGGQIGFNWLLPGRGAQLGVLGAIYARNYVNVDTLALEKRNDLEYLLQAVMLYPLRDSWYLTFAWRLDKNNSNLAAFAYDRQTFDLGLQYNFGGFSSFTGRNADPNFGRRLTY